jgi:hypothetical protein
LEGTVQDTEFKSDHVVKLEGFLPDTLYYFEIESKDEFGNVARADNNGNYYRFRTSPLNLTPLAVEIDGDGIDNDGDGYVDSDDPDGYLYVDSNIGTPDSAPDLIGSLEDKVDFGFRHWSVADGDPIHDDTDIDNIMGEHLATNDCGQILETGIFGGITEWDFNVSGPGFYILSIFGWWNDSHVYYRDDNQWKELPHPTGNFPQFYLIQLSESFARFRLENGYHFHAQIFQIMSDPFSDSASTPIHPKLYFKAEDIQTLRDKTATVAVLGDSTDSYWYFLLHGWGSASFYLDLDFSAWDHLVDPRTFANGLSYLSLAYILTYDTTYADKVIEMMMLASSWESGWGRDRSVLKNGEMLAGMAIAYDLVYGYMSPFKRDLIRRALDRECRHLWVKSLNAEHYGDGEYWWASEKSNNWMTITHGGLGVAGLALLNESKYAEEYVQQAVKISKRFMDTNFDADGVYQESYMYYDYAMAYLMIFLDALKNVTDIDLFHHNNDILQKSATWHLYGVEPSKASLTPFDNDTEDGITASPYLLSIASEYRDPLIMWHWNDIAGQNRNLAANRFLNVGGTTHLVPLVLIWYDDTIPLTSPEGILPAGAVWPDFGRTVSLTGFESHDAIHFSLQCGVGGFHGNHQDQGSFFLNAYGERLVDEGGVYDFGDSKYHNIIMIDDAGEGTPGLDEPDWAGIPEFLHTDFVDYAEADMTPAYCYGDTNPVQFASRQTLFVRPTALSDGYLVLLDQVEKGDGLTHNYEFLLHSAKGNVIEPVEDNRFRFNGKNAALEVLFAQPSSPNSIFEIEHDVPVLKVSTEHATYDGHFFSLLFPTNAEHALPDFRTVHDLQTSVIEVGNDHVVFNKTGSSVTHNNLQTDGEIFILREDQELDFAAAFRATYLTYKYLHSISTESVTNIVFSVSKNRYTVVIGNQSAVESIPGSVTIGGLIPNGTYFLTDNNVDRGTFTASENGFYAINTNFSGKHILNIALIAE